mmetsp:Transcript_19794/g.28710  ORF Transcript_19794/g.28710 Transcript_19794/m.28710 type:complete len:410 (-) Transcript_19794:210-1439(-)
MLSKWLDVGIQLGAFHRQAASYDDIRPPAFGHYPHIQNLSATRKRHQASLQNLKDQIDDAIDSNDYPAQRLLKDPRGDINAPGASPNPFTDRIPLPSLNSRQHGYKQSSNAPTAAAAADNDSKRLKVSVKIDGGQQMQPPSLFLQECAHLMSLLSAVAMSTLRNDIEGTETPLIQYVPGSPWPPVDPDKLSPHIRRQFHYENTLVITCRSLFNYSRNAKTTTLYNAARPFRVLGGVSDAEIQLLQNARGPSAKVALVSFWVQEFIARETMNGSVGNVSGPIISRLTQEISDGMLLYNQARKIAYIPFPYPHAQLSTISTIIITILVPVLMYSFDNQLVFACFLNFFTVLCFAGVHQVARELENPFKNVPNDLPLTTFQAQFNEGLITMYAGFHPESWWSVPAELSLKED